MGPKRKLKIVVSYRRSDSAMAGRIFDRLAMRFGKDSVFLDIDNIPFGVDFRKHIEQELAVCDLVIAIIGPNWTGQRDDGEPRIMSETDPVRVEIETAMRRDIPIIPVLLGGNEMPQPKQLPANLKEFTFRNALHVDSARDFNVHVDRLIKAVERLLGDRAKPASAAEAAPEKKRRVSPIVLGLGAVLLLCAIGAAVFVLIGPKGTGPLLTGVMDAKSCNTLRRVIDEARSNFDKVLGPKSGGSWTARIQMPGWDDCTISDFTYQSGGQIRYYSCTSPYFDTLEETNTELAEEDSKVQDCLGEDWTRRRFSSEKELVTLSYTAAQDDPIVALRTYDRNSQWRLGLSVDTPERHPEDETTAPGASAQSGAE